MGVLRGVTFLLSCVVVSGGTTSCSGQACIGETRGTYLLQAQQTTSSTVNLDMSAEEAEGQGGMVAQAQQEQHHETGRGSLSLRSGTKIQDKQNASCAAHPACVALGMEGDCCPFTLPDKNLMYMYCCPQGQPIAPPCPTPAPTEAMTAAPTPAPSVAHVAKPAANMPSEPEPEPEPESEGEAEDAQFLIQASFGPTVESLQELGRKTKLGWVLEQMALPASSHRAWFRERVNPPYRYGEHYAAGSLRGPCEAGARWNEYAFQKRDEGKTLEVKGGTEVWVDGTFRTGIEHGSLSTRWTALTDWSGYVCTVYETPGGDVKISTSSGCSSGPVMPNLAPFAGSAPNIALHLRLVKKGAGVLISEMADCALATPDSHAQQPIIVKSYSKYYIYDPRFALMENTPEEPLSDPAACPKKHILNEQGCKVTEFKAHNASVPGFKAELFAEKGGFPSTLEQLTIVEEINVPTLDYPSGMSAFSRATDYSARFTAELLISVGGFYYFYLTSDDGSNLWINGQEVVNHGGTHGMEEKEGFLNLEPGAHDLVVEYFQGNGPSGLTLFYSGPDTGNERVIMPSSVVQALPPSFTGCFFVCGSPGEAANSPSLGHQLPMRMTGRRRRVATDLNVDTKYYRYWEIPVTKQAVWVNLALSAPDQLRQRMAWALSQIFVVSEQGQSATDLNERWLHYYDIFVHNAFGSFWDILTSVTFSPLMGTYLTHTGSSSLDYNGMFPNENYAREVMQLFTIGLHMLNRNGSVQVDSSGEPLPTYDQKHILNFARVFTGFEKQPTRLNIETGDNHIDPMRISISKHDVHPKPDLDGNYLGDGYPLCTDSLPAQSFLLKESRYEFKGPYGNGDAVVLSDGSALMAALCGGTSSSAACSFSPVVILPRTLACNGQECETDVVHLVKIGASGMHYQYVPPTCVHPWIREQTEDETSLFDRNPAPTPGYCVDSSGKQSGGRVLLDAKDEGDGEERKQECMNMCLAAGGTGCELRFNRGGAGCYVLTREVSNGQGHTKYWCWSFSSDTGKRGRSYMVIPGGQQACPPGTEVESANECRVAHAMLGLPVGNVWAGKNANTPQRCSFYNKMHWQYGSGRRASWMKTICRAHVTVDERGEVSDGTSKTTFNPVWIGGQPAPGVSSVSYSSSVPFSTIPNCEEIMQLKVGAYVPTAACSAGCDGEVKAYYGASGTIDGDTVFEFEGRFFKNFEMKVTVDGTSSRFRNPPVFLRTTKDAGAERAVLAEIMALLKHLYHHPNTPTFIGKRLIQRFVTSNPSPHYVEAVSDAFASGAFNGTMFSGRYGDLAATITAILLHPAAREISTNAAVSYNGALREPVLKLMHVMRALEYTDNQAQMVAFRELHNVIGQFPYESPTVFNFYLADYELPGMPVGEPEPEPEPMGADGMMEPEPEPENAVGPEFQILTPGYMVGYLNGMAMLLNQGVSHSCEYGQNIGIRALHVQENNRFHVCPQGVMAWKELGSLNTTINQLDLLLTGGRLSPMSKDVIRTVYETSSPGEKLKNAQRAIAMTPEFNTMGPTMPRTMPRTPLTVEQHEAASQYKAVVMLYLSGGADTWNMLVPRDCALQDEYMEVRTDLALQKSETLKISTTGQDCSEFGIHGSLPYVQSMYDAGDLAFVSNIGALVEPMSKETYRNGGAQKCMGLFSHSDQTNAAQTLKCQDRGTTARGAGGRIADAISGFATTSFSMAGSATWSRGVTTAVEMVDGDGTTMFHDYEEWREVVSNITVQTHGNAYAEAYTQALFDAIDSTEYLGKVMDSAKLQTSYRTDTGLQREFKQVAQMIAAREGRKAERDFFYVTYGGWDHHSNMKSSLASKLGIVNSAIAGFVKEMQAQGVWDNVVVFTESEFARTLDSNGGGSDHAWAGQHFVAGGSVKGGRVLNKYPASIAQGNARDLGRGRMIPEYPWESMMVPIARWMGMQDADAAAVFPNLHHFNSTHIIPDLFK